MIYLCELFWVKTISYLKLGLFYNVEILYIKAIYENVLQEG